MRAGDDFVKATGVNCGFSRRNPMKRVRHTLALVVCVLLIQSAQQQPSFAQASASAKATADRADGKRLRTFVDSIEQAVVGDPQLSPDGKQIVFTIDKADWKANRRVSHIYRVNADGTNQVQLTFGERGE